MNYRSLSVIEAIQYAGIPIPDVTCEPKTEAEEEAKRRRDNGCDTTRAHLAHVHSNTPGGLTVLKDGDWITRVAGGPFAVISDVQFRVNFEVPSGIVPAEDLPEDGQAVVLAPAPVIEPEPVPEPKAEVPSGPVVATAAASLEQAMTGRAASAGKAGRVRGAAG